MAENMIIHYVMLVLSLFGSTLAITCINPNGDVGLCTPLDSCHSLLSLIKTTTLRDVDRNFLRDSRCHNSAQNKIYVCCTFNIEYKNVQQSPRWVRAFERPNVPEENERFVWGTRSVSLPQPPTCGGVTIGRKIIGGTNAELYEFPWMVLLEYERANGQCAGSLINQRYVLTAAHCVTGKILTVVGKLVAVRLGEHDTSNQVDCNHSSCAPEATRILVEQTIPHEFYGTDSSKVANDIALVRMQHDVTYTDTIIPICLPFVTSSQPANKFTVAGWGATLNSARAAIKQKLEVNLVHLENCRRQFAKISTNIREDQICAGGEFQKDSCVGDSGGPLMRTHGPAWVLEGIASFGYKCGLSGWPGVYTRVSSYSTWIRSNMRS